MQAISELSIINLPKYLPDDDACWVNHRALIAKAVPPTHCMHKTIIRYNGDRSFQGDMVLLSMRHAQIYQTSKDLIARAMANTPHHCTLDEWTNSGIFFTMYHLKKVKVKLLCFPELIAPDTPIEDYIKVLDALGGAPEISYVARDAHDRSKVWGGFNWRLFEIAVNNPTNAAGLARDPPVVEDYCTAIIP